MHLDVLPNAHADTRACIDAIDAGLSPAPHPEPRREILVHWPGQRQPTIHELVAAAHSDHPRLDIAVEEEMERHRAIPQPALDEEREGASPTAELADPLATLGRNPQRYAAERLDADAAGDFAAAPPDVRTAAEGRGDLPREVIEKARASLASPERSAARQRLRSGDPHLLRAQQRPHAHLHPAEARLHGR